MTSHIVKPVIILSKDSGWQEGKNGVPSVFFEGPMSVDFLQDLVCTYTDKGKQLAITTVYATNRNPRIPIFVHVKV